MRLEVLKYNFDTKFTIRTRAFLFTSNFRLRKTNYLENKGNKNYR